MEREVRSSNQGMAAGRDIHNDHSNVVYVMQSFGSGDVVAGNQVKIIESADERSRDYVALKQRAIHTELEAKRRGWTGLGMMIGGGYFLQFEFVHDLAAVVAGVGLLVFFSSSGLFNEAKRIREKLYV